MADKLRDFGQGVSRGFWADGIGGPVDMITVLANLGIAGGGYAGHKLGLLDRPPSLIENPIGGSEWIAQKMRGAGLLGDNPGSTADSYGRVAGGLLAPLTAARAPQIANALQQAPAALQRGAYAVGEKGADMMGNHLHRIGARPSMVGDAGGDASRSARMQEMGLERGWFRGGPAPTNNARTGPFYTRDADEAANYAKRFGAAGDVREYAIPAGGYLDAGRGYSHRLAHDVAALVDTPYYGKKGASLAKELRTYEPGEGLTGGQLWQSLEAHFGNDDAAAVLDKLGAFRGVKGITGPDEAMVFKSGAVRDAKKAAFDPGKYTIDNIMAGVGGATVVGGSALSGLLDKRRQD